MTSISTDAAYAIGGANNAPIMQMTVAISTPAVTIFNAGLIRAVRWVMAWTSPFHYRHTPTCRAIRHQRRFWNAGTCILHLRTYVSCGHVEAAAGQT